MADYRPMCLAVTGPSPQLQQGKPGHSVLTLHGAVVEVRATAQGAMKPREGCVGVLTIRRYQKAGSPDCRMDDFSSPSSCFISTRARHRIATLTIRDDVLTLVRRGIETVLGNRAPITPPPKTLADRSH